MTLENELAAEIRRLHYSERWPLHTIATQLHVHPDGVRRILGLASAAPDGRARIEQLMAPYGTLIAGVLRHYPDLRSTRIFDMLQARGFDGSPRTVRRYLQKVRPRIREEICLRPQPFIGEQAQIDWMHLDMVPVGPNSKRALWAFVMVLSYSRALWAELMFDLTAYSVRRSLLRAATYFGGCTRQWLFDNPKTVVLERHGQSVRLHPLVLEIASQLHVQPQLCAVRHPQSKGRVERAVRYIRDRFWAGRPFVNLDRSSAELREFLETIPPERQHPEHAPLTVRQVFAEERPRLLSLPSSMPPEEVVLPATVSKYGLVTFDTNRYSVPAAVGAGPCSVAVDDITVRVLVDSKEVSRHQRCWSKRQIVEVPEHRRLLADRKPLAQNNSAQQRLRHLVPEIDQLFLRWLDAGRNMGSMTAQTIKLLDLYGDNVFSEAARGVLAGDYHDPGALAFLCEQTRRAQNKTKPSPVILPQHAVERDVAQHNLETYDD